MWLTLGVVLAVAVVVLLLAGGARERLLEWLKARSDGFIVFLLRATSRFGSELTDEGRQEQSLWREQRLRNLRGLSLRASERWSEKGSAQWPSEAEKSGS